MPENLQIKITREEILNKDFKNSVRGYSKDEVDEFLDYIMEDYETFEQRIIELEDKINILKERNMRPTTQIPTNQMPQTNYDVLKRLSNLEKEVFGQKRSDRVE